VVEDQRRFAGLGPADEIAVHVPLAEACERHVFLNGPANQAAKLDFIITLGFLCASGLEVKKELVERFFPGKREDS